MRGRGKVREATRLLVVTVRENASSLKVECFWRQSGGKWGRVSCDEFREGWPRVWGSMVWWLAEEGARADWLVKVRSG